MTPKSQFVPENDIPDLSGKVMIVTGGNTGIGKETVKALLKKDAKVYMASRSKTRAEGAIADLKLETGKEAILLQLNLASLDSVTAAANEFKSKEKALHVLFNSGGVMIPPVEQTTSDGHDLQFGTNVLGHAHFTMCLIPELLEGAKSSSDGKARVVNTSSDAAYHTMKEGINFDSLADGPVRRKYSTARLYAQSKFGNYVFSNELARRYGEQGIVSNACHPGYLKTELQRNAPRLLVAVAGWLLQPASYGAITQLWLGTSPSTANLTGQWCIPPARVAPKFKGPNNVDELGPKLWTWVEEQRKSHL